MKYPDRSNNRSEEKSGACEHIKSVKINYFCNIYQIKQFLIENKLHTPTQLLGDVNISLLHRAIHY